MQDSDPENNVSSTRHKMIMVGDQSVGKTCIISRILGNPFQDTYSASIGIDFVSRAVSYQGKTIQLQIWDTAGQEKYKSLIPSYVRNAAVVFIVFDVTKKETFDNVTKWINFIKTIESSYIVVCGNKVDLQERKVTTNEGEELAKKEGVPYFEVSAKTNENVNRMFLSAVMELPIFDEGVDKVELLKELEEENKVGEEKQTEDSTNRKENAKDIQVQGGNTPKNVKKQCKC